MSEQAQVGDTVRLTIEGVVTEAGTVLAINGYLMNSIYSTVEILSRATPPLPSEPGTMWLDRDDDMWKVDSDGVLYCVSVEESVAANYAPFRQLVLK